MPDKPPDEGGPKGEVIKLPVRKREVQPADSPPSKELLTASGRTPQEVADQMRRDVRETQVEAQANGEVGRFFRAHWQTVLPIIQKSYADGAQRFLVRKGDGSKRSMLEYAPASRGDTALAILFPLGEAHDIRDAKRGRLEALLRPEFKGPIKPKVVYGIEHDNAEPDIFIVWQKEDEYR